MGKWTQVHLGRELVLGDCCVEGYPRWLETFKPVAGLYLLAWSGCAVVKTVGVLTAPRKALTI